MPDDISPPNRAQRAPNYPFSKASSQTHKRKASAAGLDGATKPRPVKRRASKACQCCRARKVRCNVTEHGAPCTNCRLDEVECIVSESRRKKKWNKDGDAQSDTDATPKSGHATSRSLPIASRGATEEVPDLLNASAQHRSHDAGSFAEHVPHSICQYPDQPGYFSCGYLRSESDQTSGQQLGMSLQALARTLSASNTPTAAPYLLHRSPGSDSAPFFSPPSPNDLATATLPYFIKPLPPRIGAEEIAYLEKKGALTVPSVTLRNELLKAFIEFVHPYMPLLDLYDFIMIIESGSGVLGRISLILYQAVMFAGSAFVDLQHLQDAGFTSRKEARKNFFQKTRLLYDFDYESDRVSLVQALLLLTYYYETPDDQKDTWHWMGVATSIAHTIGLHRNPHRSCVDSKRSKLWKRIWWSTYMRDRLIALGMRRPMRIKAGDYDVPMLTLDDFELAAIPESVLCVPADCVSARDVGIQRELAIMCIEKAKLCLCISQVLSRQYCVLNNNQGIANDRTTMMLLPKKGDLHTSEVKTSDEELQRWLDDLPEEAKQRDSFTGIASLDLNRSLLHMVFFTTLSALHRPQVLPSNPADGAPSPSADPDLLECSRRNVRRAASAITNLARSLDDADLVKFLPTTGVTVLLPAIIIHLLDVKAPEESTRRSSLRGFCQCMQVMGKLRDIYAAADYSTAFLEAAIRKAGIHVSPFPPHLAGVHMHPIKPQPITTVNDLVDAGRRLDMVSLLAPPPPHTARTLTPPPEHNTTATFHGAKRLVPGPVSDAEVARRLESFLASTPPESDHSSVHDFDYAPDNLPVGAATDLALFEDLTPNKFGAGLASELQVEDDFEALLNLDAIGNPSSSSDMFALNDSGVHGFTVNMDWIGQA